MIPPLLRLPLELHGDIFYYLTFLDQLSVARTCTTLRAHILAFRNLRYPPHSLRICGEFFTEAKVHAFLRPFDDTPTVPPKDGILCTVTAGKVKEYQYFGGPGSIEDDRRGNIWDGKGPLPSGSLVTLDFENIWDPRLPSDDLQRDVLVPLGFTRIVTIHGMVDVSDSPFLEEPCLLQTPKGPEENLDRKPEKNIQFGFSVSVFDDQPSNRESLEKARNIKGSIAAAQNVTVRQLLTKLVEESYTELIKVMNISPDEVLHAYIPPLRCNPEGDWGTGVVIMRVSAELRDMVWVPTSIGGEHAIMRKESLNKVKAMKSKKSWFTRKSKNLFGL